MGNPALQSQFSRETSLSFNARNLDTTALIGMRGLMALHVMAYNMAGPLSDGLTRSWLPIWLAPNMELSAFFLQSGFLLALSHGHTKYAQTPCCGELVASTEEVDELGLARFNSRHFYWRRFTRIMPLYWLTNLIMIPPILLGANDWMGMGIGAMDHDFASAFDFATVATGTTTWFIMGYTLFGLPFTRLGWPLNGPSWFVCTISFFYWIFPALLQHFQWYTTEETQSALMLHYLLQFGISFAMRTVLGKFCDGTSFVDMVLDQDAMWAARSWPITRLPVFVMGMLAGLHRASSPNSFELPGMNAILRNSPTLRYATKDNGQRWAWAVDMEVMFIVVIGALVVVSMLLWREWEDKENAEWQDMQLEATYDRASAWFELFWTGLIPILQLNIMYGLTFDTERKSYTAKICCIPWVVWLGKMSFSMFLVQLPVRSYVLYLTQLKRLPRCPQPSEIIDSDDAACQESWQAFYDSRNLPRWTVPLLCVLGIFVAWIVHVCIEEPVDKLLRGDTPRTSPESFQAKDSAPQDHGSVSENLVGENNTSSSLDKSHLVKPPQGEMSPLLPAPAER